MSISSAENESERGREGETGRDTERERAERAEGWVLNRLGGAECNWVFGSRDLPVRGPHQEVLLPATTSILNVIILDQKDFLNRTHGTGVYGSINLSLRINEPD